MKTDLKICPSEADIEIAFEKIHEHRLAIAMVEKPYNAQIKLIDDQIEEMIEPLMAQRRELESSKEEDTDQCTEAIAVLTDDIKTMVLANGKTCSTIFGTCTHVKGRKASIKWDDAALNGAIAAGHGDLDYMLGFRTEGKEGAPGTRFKLVDLED